MVAVSLSRSPITTSTNNMQTISTKFTRLLGIKSPIVSAPMYYAATPAMAAAVTKAGGFGMIAAGLDSSDKLKQEISILRKELDIPPGVPIPAGVGFLGWLLDKTEASNDQRIPTVLDELPAAIWLSFGDDLGKYIRQVRAHDQKRREAGIFPEHSTLVFVIVSSVEEALVAVNEWHSDVIIIQGGEAGGHGAAEAPSTFMLLAAVLQALPSETRPPVLAAGGITVGSQIASVLAMGADGAVVGTRFLFAHECMYSDSQKAAMLEAKMTDTVRGLAFDDVNRTNFWPKGVDGRGLRNHIWKDWEDGVELDERLKRYDEGKDKGEKERLLIWVGVGVGMVRELSPSADILRQLHDETVASLQATSRLLS